MIQGFINGIKNMINRVGSAASDIANKVKSFLHFSRPDEGPLRDYETWMPDMVEGLTKTLKKSSPRLYNESKMLAEKIKDGLSLSDIYDNMKSTVDFETQKLNANLTSNSIVEIQRNTNIQSRLESIDNNKEIIVNTTTKLDSKVLARETNKVNAKQKLQYGLT